MSRDEPLVCGNCAGGLEREERGDSAVLICPRCVVRVAGPFYDEEDIPDYVPFRPFKKNPSDEPRDLSAGVRKYVEFNDADPKTTGPLSLRQLPEAVYYVGKMKWTAYASKKWEGKSNNYVHDHDDGVKLYMTKASAGVRAVHLPEWLVRVKTFVKLGRCIGLGFIDPAGVEAESQGDGGSELYCTPNGRALLVIQDKRRLEAIIWGGKLDVQARGIVH